MSLPFIVIGAGGHAKVVVDMLRVLGETVLFATDIDLNRFGDILSDVTIKGSDQEIDKFGTGSVNLAMGIGVAGENLTVAARKRLTLARSFEERGHCFPALVHPGASVAAGCGVGPGAQIMAGAVLQADCRIDPFAIINTQASVDHDSTVGSGTHIGPGATVCGRVNIGEGCYIGAGATLVNDISLADQVFVTAGSTLTRNAMTGGKYSGAPALPKHA